MANRIVIDVVAMFRDQLTSVAAQAGRSMQNLGRRAQEAGRQVDALGRRRARPRVDADTDRGMSRLNRMRQRLRELGHTRAVARLDSIDNATSRIRAVVSSATAFARRSFNARLGIQDSDGALTRLRRISDAGKDIAGKVWRGTVKVLDYATAPLRKITNMLFNMKTLIAGIFAGAAVKKAIADPVGLSDTIESSRIAFETKLGSAQKAERFLQDIYKFDEKSPFDTIQIVGISQQMMNMGWQAENVLTDLGKIGDWAAAMGKGEDGIQRVTLALGQMRQKGKLSAEEMLQLTEAGVSGWDYLAKYFNKTIPEVREMSEKGMLDVNEAIKGIMAGMEEFAGAAEKNSDRTVKGVMGQLQSLMQTKLLLPWGEGLASGLKDGLGKVKSTLDKYKGTLADWGEGLREIGADASKWFAEKIEDGIRKVESITKRADFQEADFGGKVKILWGEMVADPISQWWNATGRDAAVNTALDIGKVIGAAIWEGIQTAFRAAPGLSALILGLGVVDTLSDIGGALGGISRIAGSASAGTGLAGLGVNAAIAMGAGNLANGASMGAAGMSALGLGSIAGGAAIAGGVLHTGKSLYNAYKSYQEGDDVGGRANTARAFTTVAGTGAGLFAGAKIGGAIGAVGGPVGALIGGGIGALAGIFAGEKIARNIESAKYETKEMKDAIKDADKSAEELAATFKKAVYKDMKSRFGDIKLSMEEISKLSNKIVWGKDFGAYEKFALATEDAAASFQNMKTAAAQTDKWLWKARLGIEFDAEETAAMKSSFDQYINAAKSYLENSHYQFTAAVSMLVDVNTEEGKSILTSGDTLYQKLTGELNQLGGKLSQTVEIALQDGVITLDEQAEISNLQQQIASITAKIANAEQKAELELIKVKFGGGKLDLDSFQNFMDMMNQTIKDRVRASDEAFTIAVSRINLQLEDGVIDHAEYKKQLATITQEYAKKIDHLRVEVMDVELAIMGEAFQNVLGSDAAEKLRSGLEKSLAEGIDPIQWDAKTAGKFLGVDGLSEEVASGIGAMLSGLAEQLSSLEVDATLSTDWAIENKVDPTIAIKASLDSSLVERIHKTIGIDITGQPEFLNAISILQSDFGIPQSQAAYISLLLTGDKRVLNHIDVIAKEFGVPASVMQTVLAKLTAQKLIANTVHVNPAHFGIPDEIAHLLGIDITGKKNILNKINVTAKDFGMPNAIRQSVAVMLSPVQQWKQARGGIIGPKGPEGFARGGMMHPRGFSEGGMVRGGAQLITVAEEGSPEMIIPLSSQRRLRGRQLWERAGHMLKVPGFSQGGIVGDSIPGGSAPAIPNREIAHLEGIGSTNVQLEIGGVTIQVDAAGTDGDLVEAIRANREAIAEEIAGVIATAMKGQFANTPARSGGIA